VLATGIELEALAGKSLVCGATCASFEHETINDDVRSTAMDIIIPAFRGLFLKFIIVKSIRPLRRKITIYVALRLKFYNFYNYISLNMIKIKNMSQIQLTDS
jgi:hypothetical protein